MGTCVLSHVLPAISASDLHTSHMPKSPPQASAPAVRRRRLRDWTPFLLVRAAHPRQALATALVLAGAAALDGRPAREIALVGGTVLVGQVILGWHNDLVDEQADLAHDRPGKPVADGRLDAGTVWFALCCAVLLVVPLAISNGVAAGLCYLASVAVGMIGNVVLRRGLLSWLTWALAFALYPAFLSYGGWGGGSHGGPPQPALVGLAALLGIGVHVLSALWGLVADNADGWTYLPLKLGLRMGATRLLILAGVYTAVVAAALLYVADDLGLRR
jgi:4-hydroxybenzoate polyprenyltransferase